MRWVSREINIMPRKSLEQQKEKNRKIRKYKKQFYAFAEEANPKLKLEYLNKNLYFKIEFIKIYPDYYKYLCISLQRQKWIERLTEQFEETERNYETTKYIFDQFKDAKDKGADNEKEFQEWKAKLKDREALYKKEKKTLKMLNRKYKYRLRDDNYFDNYLVNDWIKAYNEFADNEIYLELVSKQVDEIIMRQIKRYRFYQFGVPMDDLFQDIRVACLGALKKFDVSKGKTGREAFNYFSHICIKAGRMITTRQTDKSKQETYDSDLVDEALLGDNAANDKVYVPGDNPESDLLKQFYDYYYNMFDGKERMQLLLQIMVGFILDVKRFSFKKNDFVKYAKSFGFTSAYINEFLNRIKANKDKFKSENFLTDL